MPDIPSKLIQALKSISRLVVLTGAGTSAESGIPTFRDAQTGIWERYRPEDLATPQAFARNPQRVWEWYLWRRALIEKTAPNAGHDALVQAESRFEDFAIVTQNVDGLHQLAGSSNVIELHGSIRRYVCSTTGLDISTPWVDEQTHHGSGPPESPHDPMGKVRPAVVWFGESLPSDAIDAAVERIRNAEMVLSVGTSSVVEPAASLPLMAKQSGALVVEINPQVTGLTRHADYVVPGPSGIVLPALFNA